MIIYDGDCGVCTVLVEWAAERLPPGTATVPSRLVSDDELRSLGLCRDDVLTAVYWVDGDGRTWRAARGVARTLQRIGGAWGVLGHVAARPPLLWLAEALYPVVAANRHRIRVGPVACAVPIARPAGAATPSTADRQGPGQFALKSGSV